MSKIVSKEENIYIIDHNKIFRVFAYSKDKKEKEPTFKVNTAKVFDVNVEDMLMDNNEVYVLLASKGIYKYEETEKEFVSQLARDLMVTDKLTGAKYEVN